MIEAARNAINAIDTDRLVALTRKLVQIRSVYEPSTGGSEQQAAEFLADVMTSMQVEGVQSPLSFFLGDRYQGVNFELPDDTWSLDNTDNIEELFRLGRTKATQEFERLAPKFFDVAKPEFVPY